MLDQAFVTRLKQLEGAGRPGLLATLVKIFLRDTPPRLSSLHESLEQRDTARLEAVAHSLKSSSASLGALAMSTLCADLQVAAHDGDVVHAVALVAALDEVFDKTRSLLLDLIPDDASQAD